MDAAGGSNAYVLWCGAHRLNLVVRDFLSSLNDSVEFLKILTKFISFLRRQQTLVKQMNKTCPYYIETRWSSITHVCTWLIKHESEVKRRLTQMNKEDNIPAVEWWIILRFVHEVMKETDAIIHAIQGSTISVREQSHKLAGLVTTLHASFQVQVDEDGSSILTEDEFKSVLGGLSFEHYEVLYAQQTRQATLSDATITSIVAGGHAALIQFISSIVRINIAMNEQSDIKSLPPTCPTEFIEINDADFMSLLSAHKFRVQKHLGTQFLQDIVDNRHQLISDYNNKASFRSSVNKGGKDKPFHVAWKYCSHFCALHKFAQGLATLMSGTHTVESDFSILCYEKDEQRTGLSNFALEGQMQSKQYNDLEKVLQNLEE